MSDQFDRISAEKRLEKLYLGKTVELDTERDWVIGTVDTLAVETFKGEPSVIVTIAGKRFTIDYEYFETSVTIL